MVEVDRRTVWDGKFGHLCAVLVIIIMVEGQGKGHTQSVDLGFKLFPLLLPPCIHMAFEIHFKGGKSSFKALGLKATIIQI